MKTLPTIFFSLLIFMAGTAQTTRRVNNNPGISGTNVYLNFVDAHVAAVNGDIIIVEPSTTSYGTITVTKQLKIYGNGYFLDTNTELKKDTRPSTLGVINFTTGSGGSEMYGITCSTIQIYGVSNIIISRNNFSSVSLHTINSAGNTHTNVSNIEISRNYMGGPITIGNVSTSFTISNVQVTNNFLLYITANNDPVIQNWIVRNNTFYSYLFPITLRNAIFENNLLMDIPISFTNVTYSYNVAGLGASFPSETNGNKNNYDYVTNADFFGTSGYSTDEAWQLKAGSVPKTSSNNGGEVGAFGGNTPYIISGIPAIPSITGFINTGTGDASTPVKVTISVKSNN